MSKNNNTTKKTSSGSIKIPETRLAIIITAISLAVLLVGASIFFLVEAIISDRFFDYMTADLSQYITIKKSDYQGFKLEVDIAKPKDIEVDNRILSLLAKEKGEALYGGAEVISGFVITPGAKVNIRYRGYLLDDDGNKVEVAGMSNITESSTYQLTIGSGSFIPGFELDLVGVNTADYPKFEKITDASTDITDSHVAYVSYSKLVDGGDASKDTTKGSLVRIDLSSDEIDTKYGAGFKEKLLGATIGEKQNFDVVIDGKTYHYTDVIVGFVTDCESNPIVVTTYFPYDYSNNKNLRNETAYFEVYVDSGVLYKPAEFNEEFVKKLVEKEGSAITLEELNEYEGELLTDKYKDYLQKQVDAEYEEAYASAVKDAAWSYILSKAQVIKYPEAKVMELYEEYYFNVEYEFISTGGVVQNSYYGTSQTYSDLNSFAVAYLGLSQTDNWLSYIYEMAENTVKEKLVMYYVTRTEDVLPERSEIKDFIDKFKHNFLKKYIEQSLKSDGKTREDFTEAEYNNYVKDCEKYVFSYYDDEYFEDSLVFSLLGDELVKWPKVSTLDERRLYPFDK